MTIDAARKRFARFHGRQPQADEIGTIKLPGRGIDAFKVGALGGIIYETPDGQTYIHRIKKTSRPLLYVSSDGSQIFTLKGSVKFTERGFVDKPTSKPAKRRGRNG